MAKTEVVYYDNRNNPEHKGVTYITINPEGEYATNYRPCIAAVHFSKGKNPSVHSYNPNQITLPLDLAKKLFDFTWIETDEQKSKLFRHIHRDGFLRNI